jgi:AraC family transcriptional regulator
MHYDEEIEHVIDYIENNINNVDIAVIAKLTGIPAGLYQRIFSYLCGVSISEYIRKRRLTQAACKILQDSGTIIDIAMEYNYDSHSAFTRAVKEQFGVPPSLLTKEIFKTRAYKRSSCLEYNETYYVMKGRKVMAELVKIEYVNMEERMLIGISKSDLGVSEHELWNVYFNHGYSKILEELVDYQCDDIIEDYIGIGYSSNFKDDISLGNEYIVGAYFKPGTPVPENMISKIIPKATIAKAQVKGKNINDIIYNSYLLINDMVQKNGYILDYNNFYWSEVYTCERYGNLANDGENELILDWYIPCLKDKI